MSDLPLAGGAAVLALLALLATAWRHRGPRAEALVSVAAVALVLGTGAVPWSQARTAVTDLVPVVVFLAAILVVADVCARAGLFAAAAARLGRRAGASPTRLLVGTALLATAVTTVLSLDATVVLLTPVVVAAAVGRRASPALGAWLCLRLANSASLLLPVSNLTNLLAAPHLGVGFLGFARLMGPTLVVVVVAETLLARAQHRAELGAGRSGAAGRPPSGGSLPAELPSADPPSAELPYAEVSSGEVDPVPLVVVGAMLAGFAIGSPLGVEPGWVAAVAAVVLAWWASQRRLLTPRAVGHAANPSFALYVLALGVVVAAVADTALGSALRHLVAAVVGGGPAGDPAGPPGLATLLGIALVATLVANLVTNLSATLLVVPLVAPLGDVAVLAALIGLDVGAGLTYSGSLANLLWRRTLVGESPARVASGLARFHRRSLVSTPVVLVLAVATLWATARVS